MQRHRVVMRYEAPFESLWAVTGTDSGAVTACRVGKDSCGVQYSMDNALINALHPL